mmetsp:Transcript_504/g.850  ORF Transcript_504/g.850 Transcript_504/m.850 type:complete len:540 (-) Transcript_504:33-1652(-)
MNEENHELCGICCENQPNGSGFCQECEVLSLSLENFFKNTEIHWNTMTTKGEVWFHTCGALQFMRSQQSSFEVYQKIEVSLEDAEVIEKDVTKGRSDPETFNWDIQNALKGVEVEALREDVGQVLKAFSARNNGIGYCQGMNYVAVWLLMFMDKEHAFWMLCYLVEEWLLPDFYIGAKRGNSLNGFYIESNVLGSLIQHYIPEMNYSELTPYEFSDFFSLQFLIQLFVNTVDLESTVFLWDKLTEEGNIALQRGLTSIVQIMKEDIQNRLHPIQIVKKLPKLQVKKQLEQVYEKFTKDVTEIRVSLLRSQARDYRANQWKACQTIVFKRLEHCSNFSKEELEQLQQHFVDYTSKNRKSRDASVGISKQEFLEIILSLNSKLGHSAEGLFDRFDDDKSGYLDFRELVVCISILSKGSFEEKLKTCFDVYDIDNSGYLQSNEIEALLKSLERTFISKDVQSKRTISKVREKLLGLSRKCQDLVVFNDFLLFVKGDPVLFACFSEFVGGTQDFSELSKFFSLKDKHHEEAVSNSRCSACLLL